MSILDIVRASGGPDVVIPTLELSCPIWAESLYICAGYEDITAITESSATVTFQAAGIDVSLPKKNNDGTQKLAFAIDNVRGDAQRLINDAKEVDARITITYRTYLASDLSAPAEKPYVMTALSATMKGPVVEISAGYFDMINSAWPRDRYTAEFAPGLKYI